MYTMYESVAFFVPYRAVLEVLQDYEKKREQKGDTFPMPHNLLKPKIAMSPPAYLKNGSAIIVKTEKETISVRKCIIYLFLKKFFNVIH